MGELRIAFTWVVGFRIKVFALIDHTSETRDRAEQLRVKMYVNLGLLNEV